MTTMWNEKNGENKFWITCRSLKPCYDVFRRQGCVFFDSFNNIKLFSTNIYAAVYSTTLADANYLLCSDILPGTDTRQFVIGVYTNVISVRQRSASTLNVKILTDNWTRGAASRHTTTSCVGYHCSYVSRGFLLLMRAYKTYVRANL